MGLIAYVQDDEATADAAEALGLVMANRGFVSDLHRTLAHVPGLLRSFETFSASIKATPLAADLRELVILRVSQHLANDYEWRRHTKAALDAGVSERQILELWTWPDSPAFDDRERSVLAFVDEHVTVNDVSESTVARVGEHLGAPGVVSVCVTVGWYLLVGAVLLPLRLIDDDDTPPAPVAALSDRRTAEG